MRASGIARLGRALAIGLLVVMSAPRAHGQEADGAFFAPVFNGATAERAPVIEPEPRAEEPEEAPPAPSDEPPQAAPGELPSEDPAPPPQDVCADVDGDYMVTEQDVYLVSEAALRVPVAFKTNVDTLNETDAVDAQLTVNALLGLEVCDQIKYLASEEYQQALHRRELVSALLWIMFDLLG